MITKKRRKHRKEKREKDKKNENISEEGIRWKKEKIDKN